MKLYFGRAQYIKKDLPLITSIGDPSEKVEEIVDILREFSKTHVNDPEYPDATYYISCWEADDWNEKPPTQAPVNLWQRPLEEFIT